MRDDGNPDLEMMFVIAHKKSVAEKIMPVCQSLLHSNQVCLLIQIILQIKIFPRCFLERNKSDGGSTSNTWIFNKKIVVYQAICHVSFDQFNSYFTWHFKITVLKFE